MNPSDLEKNKAVINQFDHVFFTPDGQAEWESLVSEELVDHTAPGGPVKGKESFRSFFRAINTGLTDIKVDIVDQIAEGDLVVTHKNISGKHTGNLFGVEATNSTVAIDAIEIIRVKDGKYTDHWVRANLWEQLAQRQSAISATPTVIIS